MNKLKFAAFLAAGAALALSPAHVVAQTEAKPASIGLQIAGGPDGPEIMEVFPDRTAAAIGFKVGDILIEAGGKPVTPEVLQDYGKQLKAGDQVSFKVKRAGEMIELTGKALAAPEGEPAPAAQPQG
jgi:C-terminal processing protease CtpA/Prc